MDLMRELGPMAFASRLRRLSDRLKSEATRLYQARGIDFNDSWFLLAFMLSKRDGITVKDVSDAFGISHSAISQMASAMKRKKFIKSRQDARDRRRTLLFLTEEGRSAVKALQPIWTAIGKYTERLLTQTGEDVLSALTELEKHIKEKDLFTRVTEQGVGDALYQL
jgi:DNA-binding MarR family transcriptional regulator